MRDDILYRDSYHSTATGEYRVRRNDFGVWEVDRSTYDPRGALTWWAVPFDAPTHETAIKAHKQMRNWLDERAEQSSGYFLPEQLCQFAANFAGRLAEAGKTPGISATQGVLQVLPLLKMPLRHAITNLQRLGMIPDAANAMQAQLLLHACKLANEPGLVGWAIDMRDKDSFHWTAVEAIEEKGHILEHLKLSSPSLINQLRQRLMDLSISKAPDLPDTRAWVAKEKEWLDLAANHPLEPSSVTGTVRVTTNMEGELEAEQLSSDGSWNMLDSDFLSKTAIAAYNWSQDHIPEIIKADELKAEGFRQLAATLATRLSTSEHPLIAAQMAITLAQAESTRFYSCSREYAYPEKSTEAPEGVCYQLMQLDNHRLTREGIANMLSFMHEDTKTDCRALEAMILPQTEELALAVTTPNPLARLEQHCDPKVILRISEPGRLPLEDTARGRESMLIEMAREAGLGAYQFQSTDSLTRAVPIPNQYTVLLQQERWTMGDGDTMFSAETTDSTMVCEPDELKRLFRSRGLSVKPSVAQLGDCSWQVTWRSETPEENREYFEQGDETYYSLSLLEANGEPVTPEIAEVFAREVDVAFENPYTPRACKGLSPQFG